MVCRCKKEFCYNCGGNYPNCPCKSRQVAANVPVARGRGITGASRAAPRATGATRASRAAPRAMARGRTRERVQMRVISLRAAVTR